jgi:hypothetical protein
LLGIIFPFVNIEFYPFFKFTNIIPYYIGILPILMIVVSLFLKNKGWRFYFFFICWIISLLLILGYNTPLAKVVYSLPPYNMFRRVFAHMFGYSLFSALLSGLAFNRLLEYKKMVNRMVFSLMLALFSIFIMIYYKDKITMILNIQIDSSYPLKLWIIILVLSLFSLLLFKIKSRWQNLFLSSLLILVTADYALVKSRVIDFAKQVTAGGSCYFTRNSFTNELIPENYRNSFRVLGLYKSFHDLNNLSESLLGNTGGIYHVETLHSTSPFILKELSHIIGLTDDRVIEGSHIENLLPPENRSLDVLNVKYLLVPRSDGKLIRNIERSKRFERYEIGDTIVVYENKTVLPRVYLLPWDNTHLATGDHTLLFPGSLLIPKYLDVDRKDNVITLEVTSDQDALLVLSEWFYLGWRAEIDGVEGTLLKVYNSLFGVHLSKGTHSVKIWYSPRSVKTGLLISFLGGLSDNHPVDIREKKILIR